MKNRLQHKHSTLPFKTRKFDRTSFKRSEKEKNQSSIFLTQAAIVVLLLTALTYSFTALFKYGYHSYYKLNSLSLIKIEMNDLLNYFLMVFPFILPSLMAYILIFVTIVKPFQHAMNWKKLDKQVHYTLIILLIIYVPLSLVFNVKILNHWISYIIPLVIELLFLSYKHLPQQIQTILKYLATPMHSYKYLTILILFVFIGLTSFQLGRNIAKEQEDYLIFKKDNVDYVVISSSNNNLISAPLNLDNRSIDPVFKVVSQTDNILLQNVSFPKGIKVGKQKKLK
ncbi:hypothetical protein [Bacillus mycoides]|uniref:hypothetical protein n=1 Tax=Bacillus mycoides TaxID=1405 RepID=UPI002E0801A1|nr:hypothetical protein [Bacillus mycoides]MEC5266338.1 hypothetical protein [Bacillus mycoides]